MVLVLLVSLTVELKQNSLKYHLMQTCFNDLRPGTLHLKPHRCPALARPKSSRQHGGASKYLEARDLKRRLRRPSDCCQNKNGIHPKMYHFIICFARFIQRPLGAKHCPTNSGPISRNRHSLFFLKPPKKIKKKPAIPRHQFPVDFGFMNPVPKVDLRISPTASCAKWGRSNGPRHSLIRPLMLGGLEKPGGSAVWWPKFWYPW